MGHSDTRTEAGPRHRPNEETLFNSPNPTRFLIRNHSLRSYLLCVEGNGYCYWNTAHLYFITENVYLNRYDTDPSQNRRPTDDRKGCAHASRANVRLSLCDCSHPRALFLSQTLYLKENNCDAMWCKAAATATIQGNNS